MYYVRKQKMGSGGDHAEMGTESRREFVFMRWPEKMTFEQSPKGSEGRSM